MSERFSRVTRFLRELKRRKIYRVAVTYGGVGVVLATAAGHIFEALLFPPWAHRLFVVLLLFGFPVALVLAWAFEVTPEGVRRTAPSAEPPGGESADGRKRGWMARHGRAISLGIAAGLITLVGVGLWTAGDQPEPPRNDEAMVAGGDSGTTAAVGAAPAAREPAAREEARASGEQDSARPGVGRGSDEFGAGGAVRDEEASGGPSRATEPEASPAEAGEPEASPAEAGEPEEPASTTYSGVAILIEGESQPGHRTTENVILEELSSRGFQVLDRTSLELQRPPSGEGARQPGRLGRRIGAKVLVIGSYRSAASQAVGGFYTGTATLSLRIYESSSGRLLSSETYRVGGSDTPGKLGATPEAAASQAAEQLGYQAASALARQLDEMGASRRQDR